MRIVVAMTVLASIAAIGGCGEDRDVINDSKFVAGISIVVRDSSTGLPAACGAEAWATDGPYSERLDVACIGSGAAAEEPGTITGAYMRPGTYNIIIRKPGYQDWVREGVEVQPLYYYVATVHLEADLVRE